MNTALKILEDAIEKGQKVDKDTYFEPDYITLGILSDYYKENNEFKKADCIDFIIKYERAVFLGSEGRCWWICQYKFRNNVPFNLDIFDSILEAFLKLIEIWEFNSYIP